ncbi:MAG: FAD-binding oxidoreductase [Chloroflexi bacterium]|nr:FAD-binding oxidoreductase [Chloroflexota bacterium]
MTQTVDVVICGAGSAGVAIAYYLAQQKGITDVLVVDKHAPLTQTSAKSGENYRNWWPNSSMVSLMNRSIDLMEALADASGNIFSMARHGYAYVTAKPERDLQTYVEHYRQLDVGDCRMHNGRSQHSYIPPTNAPFASAPGGADLLFDQHLIQQNFPHFANHIQSVIHARRAGAVSAQQMGMYLLNEAKKLGIKEVRGAVTAVAQDNQGIKSVEITTANEKIKITTRTFINAAGPFTPAIAALLNIELPVYSILQQKIAIQDHHAIIPRDAPFTIFMDAQYLDWSDEEKEMLQSEPDDQWLLDKFPGGLHIKPEGGRDSPWIKLGWAINKRPEIPLWEPKGTLDFPETVLRGASRLVPGLSQYLDRLPKPIMHYAGYYTRTKENLPIIGPMGVKGAYIVGALSGFGTMASCAAGELIAAWVAGDRLPAYATHLSLARYDDPAHIASLANNQQDGEL